ncbi:hypothetical protein BDZ91DRAFT_767693 [Kalaharituber pfeilii]|nr:hypothetical protein BDZ91DRAFT_767693 [Kalaharituber pfeilii]
MAASVQLSTSLLNPLRELKRKGTPITVQRARNFAHQLVQDGSGILECNICVTVPFAVLYMGEFSDIERRPQFDSSALLALLSLVQITTKLTATTFAVAVANPVELRKRGNCNGGRKSYCCNLDENTGNVDGCLPVGDSHDVLSAHEHLLIGYIQSTACAQPNYCCGDVKSGKDSTVYYVCVPMPTP